MERVRLGSSDIEVTRLCLGTWNMDGSEGWGPKSDEESVELIRKVMDSGCNFFDSAHGYGGGHSEEVLGRALAGRRERAVCSTKLVQCDPAEAEQQLDNALARMQTDYIDIYICHWPRPSMDLDDFMGELTRLCDKGKARAIGASNFDLAQMKVAARHGAVVLQPPFNVVWRIIDEDVLPFCRENGVAVTPYSTLMQGLLTGRYTRGDAKVTGGPRQSNCIFKEPTFAKAKRAAGVVDAIADQLGATSSQVAIAWALATPGVTSPIVGISKMSHWEDNVGALDIELSEEHCNAISQAGLEVWADFTDGDTMWGWKPT